MILTDEDVRQILAYLERVTPRGQADADQLDRITLSERTAGVNKFGQGRQAAQQELLDHYWQEHDRELKRLRLGIDHYFLPPGWGEFGELWDILRDVACERAQRDFDTETRAYVARAKSLGLCKCEENAE